MDRKKLRQAIKKAHGPKYVEAIAQMADVGQGLVYKWFTSDIGHHKIQQACLTILEERQKELARLEELSLEQLQ